MSFQQRVQELNDEYDSIYGNDPLKPVSEHFRAMCERIRSAVEKRIFDLPRPGSREDLARCRGNIEYWLKPGSYPDCLQPLEDKPVKIGDILGNPMHRK